MIETARSNRYHIALFGRRNVGKSSLVNSLLGQQVSIVSSTPGTTADTVWKNIELPGVGAAVIGDTAGFDDTGSLGEARVEAARKTVARIDLAILLLGDDVTDARMELCWLEMFKKYSLPVIAVCGKSDLPSSATLREQWETALGEEVLSFSSLTGEGREALVAKIAELYRMDDNLDDITYSLAGPGDVVVLVMPQDGSAPKGRIIMPQVETLRNLLDKHCIPLCCAPEELPQLLGSLVAPPKLIITDSQVFPLVEKLTPSGTGLTSFSVLMARHKGDMEAFVEGAKVLRGLSSSARVLIAEACSHIPRNEDIGRVKLPRLLRGKFGEGLSIDIVSGNDFPEELSTYDLIIHCGACMFNRRTVISRVRAAKAQGVPITNYGVAIAALTGILDKVVY